MKSSTTRSSHRREILVIVLMTMIGGLIRIWSPGHLGLVHFDEGIYALAGLWPVLPGGFWGIDTSNEWSLEILMRRVYDSEVPRQAVRTTAWLRHRAQRRSPTHFLSASSQEARTERHAMLRERVGRVRGRPGEPGGIAVHTASTEQRAQAAEDDFAHRAAGVARHSRQAWTGTTLPGFARSSGSKARRTARMAARVSGSKMSGM